MLAPFLLVAALSADPELPATSTTAATKATSAAPVAHAPAAILANEERKPDFAVERAAREFRIAVYESYRATRDEYDARRTLGNELLKAWNVDQPARHRAGTIAWFEDAQRRTLAQQPLEPYAEFDDLKSKTVSEELPEDAANATAASGSEVKLPPPFVFDKPAADGKPAIESLFNRLKSLIIPPAKPETVEPAPEKSGS